MNSLKLSIFNNFFSLSFIGILITIIINYTFIPLIINFGAKFKILDLPDKRKQHKIPLVRLGGISIALASLSTFCFINKFALHNSLYSLDNNITHIILISSSLMLILGIIDDIFSLSPWPRLGLQIVMACYMWSKGISIESINIFGLINQANIINLPSFISLIFTVIWIVGFTNALNWIDGIDGLAISLVSIALIGNLFLFYLTNNLELILLLFFVLTSCLVFMRFNLKPSKIIMGDGGCYFLGYFLAATSLMASTNENKVTFIATPLLFFAVPIIDMTVVIFKRILKSKSPFHGDRRHIHHILLDKNFSENQIVLMLGNFSQWGMILGLKLFSNRINLTTLFFSSFLLLIGTFFITKKRFIR